MTSPLYSVIVPRAILEDIKREDRAILYEVFLQLHNLGVVTREDEIDNVEYDDQPAYEGVRYFTNNEAVFKILTEISKSGFIGYSKNKSTIDSLIEGN